jgi:hypothetical protein
MSGPPESLILQILREMRAELASKADLNVLRAEVTELRFELSDVKFDMRSLRAGVASDLLSIHPICCPSGENGATRSSACAEP